MTRKDGLPVQMLSRHVQGDLSNHSEARRGPPAVRNSSTAELQNSRRTRMNWNSIASSNNFTLLPAGNHALYICMYACPR
jgi:hypothetical protein